MKKAIAIPPTKMASDLERLQKVRVARISEEKKVKESMLTGLSFTISRSTL